MASKNVVTYECDGCGKASTDELEVLAHRVQVDGATTILVDACEKCWTKATTPLDKLLAKGRREIRRRKRRIAAA